MANPAECVCGQSPGGSERYGRNVCSYANVDNGDRYGAPTMPKIVLPYYYKELLVSLLERLVERLVERLFERSRISMNAASQSCACSSDQEYQ